MNENKNIQTISDIYAAFGRGDIPYIIDQLSTDVRWVCRLDPVVPGSGDFSGKGNVPEFFDAIFCSTEVLGFEPGEYVAQGDTVVSQGTYSFRAKSTGKSATTNWIFVWKLQDGKVVSYEQFHDPAIAEPYRA